jgi:hypothetical protein
MFEKVLLSKYTVALGIPIILMICGSVAKKLVRGSGWEKPDFYLGVEFALAAMSSAFLHIYDLASEIQKMNSGSGSPATPLSQTVAASINQLHTQLSLTAGFLCVTFCLLLYILALHQDWEKHKGVNGQFLRLGIWSNLLGCGLMCAFVLLVKRI